MLLSLKMIASGCSMHCVVYCDCSMCCGMHCNSAKCMDSFTLWALPVCARLLGSCPEMHLSLLVAGGLLRTLQSVPEQQSFTGKQQDHTPRSTWDAGVCPAEGVAIPLYSKVALGKPKPLLEERTSAADGQQESKYADFR